MKKTKYTVDYFIKKFSAIPDDQWTIGTYKNYAGQKCALGHCGFHFSNTKGALGPVYTTEGTELVDLFLSKLAVRVSYINDCSDRQSNFQEEYEQLGDTPKKRILTVLELIKAGVRV